MAALRTLSALLVVLIGSQGVLASPLPDDLSDVLEEDRRSERNEAVLGLIAKARIEDAVPASNLDWIQSVIGVSAVRQRENPVCTLILLSKKALDEGRVTRKQAQGLILSASNRKSFYTKEDQSCSEVLKEALKIGQEDKSVSQEVSEVLKNWGADACKRHELSTPKTSKNGAKDLSENVETTLEFLRRARLADKITPDQLSLCAVVAVKGDINNKESAIVTLIVTLVKAIKEGQISPEVAADVLATNSDGELLFKNGVSRTEVLKEALETSVSQQAISQDAADKLNKWAANSGN